MVRTENFPLQQETQTLIGIGIEIHKQLGPGFLEIVYKEAFEFELATEGSPPLEVNDKCRLITDAGETDVEVIHVLETQGLTFTTFVFKQPYSTEFSSNC